MNLFVYYKFIPAQAPAARTRIATMQKTLCGEFELSRCALMKRPTTGEDGRETWMEVYEYNDSQSDVFEQRLNFLAQQAQLPHPRRNEVFVSLIDCFHD